jgi:hypothetical protein
MISFNFTEGAGGRELKWQRNLSSINLIYSHLATMLKRDWASKLTFGAIIIIILYFIVCQIIDSDKTIIGGPKYLVNEDNVLRLSLKKRFNILEIYFTDDVNLSKGHQIFVVKEKISPLMFSDYEVISSSDKKSVQITVKDSKEISGWIELYIYFKGVGARDFPTRKYIKAISFDGDDIGITYFYKTLLNHEASNLRYYKAFDINSMSNYLAVNFGKKLIYSITFFLIVILAVQLFIFFLTTVKSLLSKKDLQLGLGSKSPMNTINIIDIISEEYAVIFGFLGTVLSMWVALETSGLDYSNFFEILDLVKFAIFTTVLGLIIKCIYGIREFVFKLETTEGGNGSNEE